MRTMHSIPQIEPGPASHDQARRDGTHLVSCCDRGIRGAINAVSYFQAKAADPNVGLHGGCGPIAPSMVRAGYQVLVNFALSDLGVRSRCQRRRASRRPTVVGCHTPPRAVRTCRLLNSSVMAPGRTMPEALSSAIIGAISWANRSAFRLLDIAPWPPRFRGDVGPCFSAIGITRRGPHRRVAARPPPSSGATAPVANFSAWILRYEPQRSLPKSRLGRVSGDPARAPVLTL